MLVVVGVAACGHHGYSPSSQDDAGAELDATATLDAGMADAAIQLLDAAPNPACIKVPQDSCNRVDDDNDGVVDNGYQLSVQSVPTADLIAQQNQCTGPNGSLDLCLTASHRWCREIHPDGCYETGAGFLAGDESETRVACFGADVAFQLVELADLTVQTGAVIDNSNIYLRYAQQAVHDYCKAVGAPAGIGPVEYDLDAGWMRLACLSPCTTRMRNFTLSEFLQEGCNLTSGDSVSSLDCSRASDELCTSSGYQAGHGPYDVAADSALVICLL